MLVPTAAAMNEDRGIFDDLSYAALRGGFAGALAALAMIAIDSWARTRWGTSTRAHLAATVPVIVSIAAFVGALLATGGSLRKSARLRDRALAVFVVASLVGLAARGATFAGPLRATVLAKLVPWSLAAVAAVIAAVWMALDRRAITWQRRALLTVASIASGALLFWADSRFMVGTQRGVHDAVEAASFLLLYGAFITPLSRQAPLRSPVVFPLVLVAAVAAAWQTSSACARAANATELRHLLHEPSALGAFVTRLASVEGGSGHERRDPDARWTLGEDESHEEMAAAVHLRATCGDCNIVVYFVDTLRADTAADPSSMPALARFTERSVSFPHAYSAASDTLHALPAMLAGRYDDTSAPTFVQRAREARLDNSLFIAASARDYLAAQLPAFEFDETYAAADRSDEEPVWGYGADVPTGDALTVRALDWMRTRRNSRFFAWIYNYDLHGWRDLRDDELDPTPPPDPTDERYRSVARTVDRSFSRLLDGLDDLGLSERTVVLFVSDHGEALGYRGFIAHSAFLWQPLVRVPLAVRVPGVAPRIVERQVSLVDVAPTLARFVDPATDLGGYHGVDLLRFYAYPDSARALPILLTASAEGRPSLLGVVHDTRKLIVPAAGGPAQLHDLSQDDPDDTDIALIEPDRASQLLGELVTSPLSAMQ